MATEDHTSGRMMGMEKIRKERVEVHKTQGKEAFAKTEYARMPERISGAVSELLSLSGQRNPFKQGRLGVVEDGAYADLVIVNGNPLEDISPLADPEKNVHLIMKDGKIYKNTL